MYGSLRASRLNAGCRVIDEYDPTGFVGDDYAFCELPENCRLLCRQRLKTCWRCAHRCSRLTARRKGGVLISYQNSAYRLSQECETFAAHPEEACKLVSQGKLPVPRRYAELATARSAPIPLELRWRAPRIGHGSRHGPASRRPLHSPYISRRLVSPSPLEVLRAPSFRHPRQPNVTFRLHLQ